MTETNRAAVLHAARDIRIEERPVPLVREGDVLVKVTAVGICGSDVHYFQHGRIADNVVTAPVVLGHESAGIVVVGTAELPEGTRVAIEPQRPCGECEWCLTGAYNLCPKVEFMADPPVNGALTNLVAAPAKFCHPLPDNVTDEEGALVEPLSVALWAALKIRITGGDAVLISGAGPVGLLAAQVARALGATRVVVGDINEHRLAVAARLGAETRLASSEGYGDLGSIDAVIECSGAPSSIRGSIGTLNPRGRIAAVGIGRSPRTEIDLLRIQSKEVELVGVYRYAGIYRRVIDLVATGQVDVKSLITNHFDLDHSFDALDLSRTDAYSLKAVVTP